METKEEKLERIKKFGMDDGEIFSDEESIDVLSAQNIYLERQVNVLKSALEKIASGLLTQDESKNLSQYALELTELRSWRNSV